MSGIVAIIGMGEVGRPLARILSRTYRCREIDLAPVTIDEPCSVLHVCYPFHTTFVKDTVAYAENYKPRLIIINSTVVPGTTEAVGELAGAAVAYSPVRGKHARMEQDLLRYKKFVAGCDPEVTRAAQEHFANAGFATDTFRNLRIAEVSKLLETTYLGVLVAWSQEIDRIAKANGGDFGDVHSFLEEIDFLPRHIVPGVIGGHCVMPNIALLSQQNPSLFLHAVVESNRRLQEQPASTVAGNPPCLISV